MSQVDLAQYESYRDYLKDFYKSQKAKNPSYSYRVFSQKAKLSSPNYLKLVMDGTRRITDRTLPNFVRGLKLSPVEAAFFRSLVQFEDATDEETKAQFERERAQLRRRLRYAPKGVRPESLAWLGDWSPWVIREMVALAEFKADPTWIASRLRGRVTPAEVERTLKRLLSAGLIEADRDGRYRAKDLHLTTEDREEASLSLQKLHGEFLDLAKESLTRDASSSREMNGLVLPIATSRMAELKGFLREVRKEINRRFSHAEGNDEVYYLSMALFPVTGSSSTKKT